MEKMKSSKFWWLNAHNSPKRSTCLQSTIQELDEKTMSILKIIEEDADSFAQRANMFYWKRPQLISMVEDLYRSHRSLAENFYAAKLESRNCFKTKLLDKFGSAPAGCGGYDDTYTESLDSDQCSSESEVDDPDMEDEMEVLDEVSSGLVMSQEIMKLRQEMERLQYENRIQQEALVHKDEEKREMIRQLSLAMDMMKEENLKLRRSLAATAKHSSPNKKWNITPELHTFKLFFSKT